MMFECILLSNKLDHDRLFVLVTSDHHDLNVIFLVHLRYLGKQRNEGCNACRIAIQKKAMAIEGQEKFSAAATSEPMYRRSAHLSS